MISKLFISGIVLLYLFTETVHAQSVRFRYESSSTSVYFRQLPNAAMEATGKNFMMSSGNNSAAHLNPAVLAQSAGLSLEYSSLNHDNSFREKNDSFLGITVPVYSRLTIGASYYSIKYNTIITENHTRYHIRCFSVRASYKLFNHTSIGLNINSIRDKYSVYKITIVYSDFGIFYKRPLEAIKWLDSFSVGFSVTNVAKSKLTVKEFDTVLDKKYPFPALAHTGIALSGSLESVTEKLKLKKLSWTAAIEYQDDLVSDIYSGIRLGAETSLYELLKLRCGYYRILRYNDLDDIEKKYVKNYLADFTFGMGIYLPVSRILENNFPIEFSLDFIVNGAPHTSKDNDKQMISLFGDNRYYEFQITTVWKK